MLEKVLDMFTDFDTMTSEDKYEAIEGEGIKISTPQQILQRLSIAPKQMKVGNTTKDLFIEIWKTAYSLNRANKITKKVHNNVI